MGNQVLIVDDDFGIVQSLCDVLSDEGYQVAGAYDGREALERLHRGLKPCLIILDWMMPGWDGPTFRAAQLADAELATIPVVLLTADYSLDEKKRSLAVDAYLRKPVRLTDLFVVIARYCGCPSA